MSQKFLAALAEEAKEQAEKNLKLQKELILLTKALAVLTAALFFLTVYLSYDTYLKNKRYEAQHLNDAKPQQTKP